VATANDARQIPDPILNRMNVFEVAMPDEDAARKIAARLYRSIRDHHDWVRASPRARRGRAGGPGRLAPREMRRALMTAFGNAKLDGRDAIEPRDLPEQGGKRSPIGFMH